MLNAYMNMMTKFINKYGSEKTIAAQAAVMEEYNRMLAVKTLTEALLEANAESISEEEAAASAEAVVAVQETQKQAVAKLIATLEQEILATQAIVDAKPLEFIKAQELSKMKALRANVEGKSDTVVFDLFRQFESVNKPAGKPKANSKSKNGK